MRQVSSYSYAKFQGTLTEKHKRHLLNRTLFGCSYEDFQSFDNLSLEESIQKLITESPSPPPPLNYYESQHADPSGVKEGDTWVFAPFGDGVVNFWRNQSLRYWWIQNMWFQERTIHEKMILFWHNHFATQIEIYEIARMAYKHHDTLRKFALGNFKDFVKAITIDAAMLEYLNGQRNTKESPDENYARELQELFTLGKGSQSGYTEEDVRAAARVLTGHRFSWLNKYNHQFRAENHDQGDKIFSEFYGNIVIKGRTGNEGAEELDELIDMIFKSEEVSRFIVRKLYRFFLYYEITDQIETEFIEPLAKIFRENNYEIKPLLSAFFSSEHFLDPAFFGALISSPLEFTIKTLKHLNPPLPTLEESIYLNYSVSGVYMRFAETTQQHIGDPPSVSGWPAYYQSPLYHEIWINSDTYQKRNQSLLILIYNEVRREGYRVIVDVIGFVAKLNDPENPVALINELCTLLFSVSIDDEVKAKIKKDILLFGQSNDFYWTELWRSHTDNPKDTAIKDMLEQRLRYLVLYIMSLPEYQLI